MVDRIPVAIVRWDLSDDYNRHTAASMLSMMEHCSKPIDFYLIYDEQVSSLNTPATNENMQKYKNMVKDYESNVFFKKIDLPKWILGNKKNNGLNRWSPAVFFRFYFPDIFTEFPKIISLASDVIVKTDLAKLYDIDIGNYSMAGVIDQGMEQALNTNRKRERYFKSVGIPTENYVNTDILIFNLEKIRKIRSLPNRAVEFFKSHQSTPYLDQDTFNAIFRDDIYILPNRYNLMTNVKESWNLIDNTIESCNSTPDYILHYASEKPWNGYHTKYEYEYWHYLYNTPWGKDDVTYNYISKSLKPFSEMVIDIDEYIWKLPIRKKISAMWNMTIPLYLKIIKKYIHQFII